MRIDFLKFVAISLMVFGFIACNDDDSFSENKTPIGYNELPLNSRELIENNFSGAEAVNVFKFLMPDTDGSIFEVRLNNGFELEFSEDGHLTDADGNGQLIPNGLVFEPILNYVQTNYPDNFIVEIDFEQTAYEIELNNDLGLRFDLVGNFIGFDD